MPAACTSTLTPAQRTLHARLAAHTSWANTTDPLARTAPARAASNARFEREVDPDGVLPPDERARRADHARKAYFTRLALKSAQSRRRAGNARENAAIQDQIRATVAPPAAQKVYHVYEF